jgi:hypothetical protein
VAAAGDEKNQEEENEKSRGANGKARFFAGLSVYWPDRIEAGLVARYLHLLVVGC